MRKSIRNENPVIGDKHACRLRQAVCGEATTARGVEHSQLPVNASSCCILTSCDAHKHRKNEGPHDATAEKRGKEEGRGKRKNFVGPFRQWNSRRGTPPSSEKRGQLSQPFFFSFFFSPEMELPPTKKEHTECAFPFSADVWSMVLTRVGRRDRLNTLLVCKKSLEVGLTRVWQPWANKGRGMVFAMERGFFSFYTRWAAVAGARWDPSRSIYTGQGYFEDAFVFVCRMGHLDFVRLFLADLRIVPSVVAFEYAAEYGHVAVVELLLGNSGVHPGSNNDCALRAASAKGHLEVVRLLLLHPRVDPTALENRALRNAEIREHSEVARLLLQDPRVRSFEKQIRSVEKRKAAVRYWSLFSCCCCRKFKDELEQEYSVTRLIFPISPLW